MDPNYYTPITPGLLVGSSVVLNALIYMAYDSLTFSKRLVKKIQSKCGVNLTSNEAEKLYSELVFGIGLELVDEVDSNANKLAKQLENIVGLDKIKKINRKMGPKYREYTGACAQ